MAQHTFSILSRAFVFTAVSLDSYRDVYDMYHYIYDAYTCFYAFIRITIM